MSEDTKDTTTNKPQLYLQLSASVTFQPFTDQLIATGASLEKFEKPWSSQFYCSGAKHSVEHPVDVGYNKPKQILVPIDCSYEITEENGQNVVTIPHGERFIIKVKKTCAQIQNSVCLSISGTGEIDIKDIFVDDVVQVPLKYSQFAMYQAIYVLSDPKIVSKSKHTDETNIKYTHKFKEATDEFKANVENFNNLINTYVTYGYNLRMDSIVYEKAQGLTKTFAYDNASEIKYSFVYQMLESHTLMSLSKIDQGLKAALMCWAHPSDKTDMNTFGFSESDEDKQKRLEELLKDTESPGLSAAKRAVDMICALNHFNSTEAVYKSDTATTITDQGVQSVSVEKWPRYPMGGPLDSDDCDGLGIRQIQVINKLIDCTEKDLDNYPYARALKNAIYPHYQIGGAVISANGAEATENGFKKVLGGHFIGIAIPTKRMLSAISLASSSCIGDTKSMYNLEEGKKEKSETVRFQAVYSADVVSKFKEEERTNFKDYESFENWKEMDELPVLALEGTAPVCSPVIQHEPNIRTKLQSAAVRVKNCLYRNEVKTGPFRIVTNVDGFYADILEMTITPKNPLFVDDEVSNNKLACTQFLLSSGADTEPIKTCGVNTHDMSIGNFKMLPMVPFGTSSTTKMTKMDEMSERHVMKETNQYGMECLDATRLEKYNRSIELLKGLDKKLSKEPVRETQRVVMTVSMSDLIFNDDQIKLVCDSIAHHAVYGKVDMIKIPDSIYNTKGYYVVVHAAFYDKRS